MVGATGGERGPSRLARDLRKTISRSFFAGTSKNEGVQFARGNVTPGHGSEPSRDARDRTFPIPLLGCLWKRLMGDHSPPSIQFMLLSPLLRIIAAGTTPLTDVIYSDTWAGDKFEVQSGNEGAPRANESRKSKTR